MCNQIFMRREKCSEALDICREHIHQVDKELDYYEEERSRPNR